MLVAGACAQGETVERYAVGGSELALERFGGSGPSVVFVSGMGDDTSSWRPVAAVLARCARVVLYDRAGTGRSGPLRRNRLLASQAADDLAELLAQARVSAPYVLVAHSLAGLYVQAFARTRPQAVAAIVLVDASSPLEPPGVFVSTVPPAPGSAAAAEDDGFAPSLAELAQAPPLPDVPLLVLIADSHGDTAEREALWRDVQRRTAALVPRGRASVVEGAGHFIQSDRPQAVIEGVVDTAQRAGFDLSACR
jgi:pimeloyl-ACP methyl ester carboxylesterase